MASRSFCDSGNRLISLNVIGKTSLLMQIPIPIACSGRDRTNNGTKLIISFHTSPNSGQKCHICITSGRVSYCMHHAVKKVLARATGKHSIYKCFVSDC